MFLLMLTICISFVFGDSEPLVNTWNGYVTIDANTSTNGAVVGVFVNDVNTLNVVVGNCSCPVGFYVANVPCADGDDITFKVYGVSVTHATQTCIVGRTTYVKLNLTMSKLASGATCTYASACNTTYCCDTSSYTNCNGDCTGTCSNSCTAPTTPSGGGGGGAAVTTTVISFTTSGVDVSLAKNNIAKFAFDGAYHTIKVTKIGADYVTLQIASDTVTVTLKLLESRKLDLNNDNYYDLYVKLNEIKSSKAYLTVKYIHEIITPVVTPPAEEEEEEEPEEVPEEEPEEEPEEVPPVEPIEEPPAKLTWLWILIILLIIGLIAYLIYKKKKEY